MTSRSELAAALAFNRRRIAASLQVGAQGHPHEAVRCRRALAGGVALVALLLLATAVKTMLAGA